MFAAGDQVAQFGSTAAGTVNATGVAFDVHEVHVLTLRDDKIARFAAPRQPNRQGERRASPAAPRGHAPQSAAARSCLRFRGAVRACT